jgi:hypothetical protein
VKLIAWTPLNPGCSSLEANSHSAGQKDSSRVMGFDGLLCSQDPATVPYPELDEFSPHPHIVFKILVYFNNIPHPPLTSSGITSIGSL